MAPFFPSQEVLPIPRPMTSSRFDYKDTDDAQELHHRNRQDRLRAASPARRAALSAASCSWRSAGRAFWRCCHTPISTKAEKTSTWISFYCRRSRTSGRSGTWRQSANRATARNYLVPTGRATMATAANIAKFEAQRHELEAKGGVKHLAAARTRAANFRNFTLELKAKAGSEGKLFGSIGIGGHRRGRGQGGAIRLAQRSTHCRTGPIRSPGEHQVQLHLPHWTSM